MCYTITSPFPGGKRTIDTSHAPIDQLIELRTKWLQGYVQIHPLFASLATSGHIRLQVCSSLLQQIYYTIIYD